MQLNCKNWWKFLYCTLFFFQWPSYLCEYDVSMSKCHVTQVKCHKWSKSKYETHHHVANMHHKSFVSVCTKIVKELYNITNYWKALQKHHKYFFVTLHIFTTLQAWNSQIVIIAMYGHSGNSIATFYISSYLCRHFFNTL